MNKHKLFIAGLSVLLFAASCKKTDVSPTKEKQNVATASDWKSAADWTSSKEEKYIVNSSKFQDNSISSAIIENGLVLVYMKNASLIEALPSQQKDIYWYYQVSENTIEINADVYGTDELENKTNFKYFVLTEERLKSLEEKGHSRSELMGLTYEDAATLLK